MVRTRWVLAAVGAVVVIVAAVVLLAGPRAPKTWIVQPGQTLHVPAHEVLAGDRWGCPGKGGATGTPPPGHGVGGSGGFSIAVDADGNVTASCEPGPPAEL